MRKDFQTIIRKFGLLNKTCCSVDSIELSVIQSHILYEIDSNKEPSMQQVADLLGIDITTFSRQIQNLVKIGLVQKVVSLEDKRVTNLVLTELGKHVACEIDSQVNQFIEDIFIGMTEFEKDTVQRSLKMLADSMNPMTTMGCNRKTESKC